MGDPIRIFSQAATINVRYDGESTGPAEPYLWAFHWKVDGENLSIRLKLGFSDTNLTAIQAPTLESEFEPFVFSPALSHGNLPPVETETTVGGIPVWLPTPNNPQAMRTLTIPNEVGRFEGDMLPIPIAIDFTIPDDWRGAVFAFAPEQLSESVLYALDQLESLGEVWRLLFPGEVDFTLGDVTDWLSEPATDDCPPLSGAQLEVMVEHFASEFVSSINGGIDGMFGSVFVLMEQDAYTAQHAEEARQGVVDMLKDFLTRTVSSISLVSPMPNPEPYQEEIGIGLGVKFVLRLLSPPFDDVVQAWEALGMLPDAWADLNEPAPYGDPEGDVYSIMMKAQLVTMLTNAVLEGPAGVAALIDADDPLLLVEYQMSPADFLSVNEETYSPPASSGSNTFLPGGGNWAIVVRTGPA